MSSKSVQPEDVLPDGLDCSEMNGRIVRKGTIAAFLANIEILEDSNINEKQKYEIISTLKELAPSVIAIGLHKHVKFKNLEIEKILLDVYSDQ